MKIPDKKTLETLPEQAIYVASAVGVALMIGAVWGVTRLFKRETVDAASAPVPKTPAKTRPAK